METMHDYIKEESVLIHNNVKNRKELTNDIVKKFLEKDFTKISIIASGSSYNGSEGARLFLEKVLKTKVNLFTSFTYQNYETIFDRDTFVIGVSQSGRSTNTNDALDVARSHGLTTVALTGNVEAVMKDHADVISNWGMGIEKIGFVTKGVTTLTLFLDLFALEAGLQKKTITSDEYNSYISDLIELSNVAKEVEIRANAWYHANEEELTDLKRVQILGYGFSYASSLEGALKIAETTGHAATAYELEEYLHGPMIETNKERTVIVIDSGGVASERANAIFNSIHEVTDRAYLITNKESDGPKVLTVPCVSEWFTPIVNYIPFQVIAAYGRDKWVNPLEKTRKDIVDKLGYKSPLTGKEKGL